MFVKLRLKMFAMILFKPHKKPLFTIKKPPLKPLLMKPLSKDTKAKAFKYYCMGLNSHEIGKLLDCSHRTIQNFMSLEKWKDKKAKAKGR